MDPFSLGLAGAGALSSIAGGLLGGKDARDAEREQRRLINEARGLFGQGRGAIDDAELAALEDIDAANMILSGIEPAVLAGLDEQLRVRVAQQMMQNQQQQAQMQQRAASGGLDATTVMSQLQRGQNFGQANQIGGLASSFAGQRSQAIMQARFAHAQGLNNRASAIGGFGAQRASMFGQEAGFLGGVQIQPANTGAALGALGGSLFNAASDFFGDDDDRKPSTPYYGKY